MSSRFSLGYNSIRGTRDVCSQITVRARSLLAVFLLHMSLFFLNLDAPLRQPLLIVPYSSHAAGGRACTPAAEDAIPFTIRLRPSHLTRQKSYGQIKTTPSGHRLWAFRNVALSDTHDDQERFVHLYPDPRYEAPQGFEQQGEMSVNGFAFSGYAGAFNTAFFDAEEDGVFVDTGLNNSSVNPCTAPEDAVFLVIDTVSNGALGHWMSESALFLYLWEDLNLMHPGIRLILSQEKNFKHLFLPAFDIPLDRVLFTDKIPSNRSNLVYFPPLFLVNNPWLDLGLGARSYASMMGRIRKYAGLDPLCGGAEERANKLRLLLLPRGKKENFKWNDREIRHEKETIQHYNETPFHVVYYTDDVKDIREQVRLVASADIIVTHEGSAMYLNGAFARNSSLVVLGALGDQHKDVHALRALWAYMEAFNSIARVDSWLNLWDVTAMIDERLARPRWEKKDCHLPEFFRPLPGGEVGSSW
jgi:Glycosyltransferase 61